MRLCAFAVGIAFTFGMTCAKPLPPLVPIPLLANGEYGYEDVVDAPGLSQDELFQRARTWIAMTYKVGGKQVVQHQKSGVDVLVGGRGKEVIGVEAPYYAPDRAPSEKCYLLAAGQSIDKDAGSLVASGTFSIEHPYCSRQGAVDIECTLTIMVKDGRWKYRFSDFSTDYADGHLFKCKGDDIALTAVTVDKRYGREVVNHATNASAAILAALKAAMNRPVENW